MLARTKRGLLLAIAMTVFVTGGCTLLTSIGNGVALEDHRRKGGAAVESRIGTPQLPVDSISRRLEDLERLDHCLVRAARPVGGE